MITMITAEEANELREKHTKVIEEVIKNIELEIKKKAIEVNSPKVVQFNIISYNEIVIAMVIEILKCHNYNCNISIPFEDKKLLQITWE